MFSAALDFSFSTSTNYFILFYYILYILRYESLVGQKGKKPRPYISYLSHVGLQVIDLFIHSVFGGSRNQFFTSAINKFQYEGIYKCMFNGVLGWILNFLHGNL